MPKDLNPIDVVIDPTYNSPQDVAGNPTIGSGVTGGVRVRPYLASPPASETGETNPPPLLVTPQVEASPIPPKGSGASVVAEPELGTPIVKEQPTPITVSGIQTGGTTGGVTGGIGGGSGGSGGSADTETENASTPNTPKKKNYVLYGGILLALIIAYKLLSKKKKK